MNAITVTGLSKQFTFPVRNPKKGWLGNLLKPDRREITAVKDVSFTVERGERLAFIGPNGAGKSTTIKMMTGILFPTAGTIRVLGYDPAKERKRLAYHIGTVFGQRSQLLPNLPLTDSLEFYGVMYDLTAKQIQKRTAELVDLFDLGGFIDQPVRKLSLGQRMRAEVASSLIHKPKIIFLDEPTIGLDVVAKKSLRDLLLAVNKEENTTVFLTSHDVGDIETLCDRTIVINHGTVIQDGPTQELSKSFISEKFIKLVPKDAFTRFPRLPKGITYREKDRNSIVVAVSLSVISVHEALQKLLALFDVEDMDVYNADMETVIRHIYEAA